ncbi:MAG: hypothetical protein ACRERU_18865 [Methylococcales bacterium]
MKLLSREDLKKIAGAVVLVSAVFTPVTRAAPGEPMISGSTITNVGTVSNANVEGVQGASGGGGGRFSIGGLKGGGNGGRQTASLASELNVGELLIKSGTISGSSITQQGTAANVSVKGGSVTVGRTVIGQ